MKVVVNRCYGGFGLSPKAHIMIAKRKGLDIFFYVNKYNDGSGRKNYYKVTNIKELDKEFCFHIVFKDLGDVTTSDEVNANNYKNQWFDDESRADSDLVAVVEELGEEANGKYAQLEVIKIPDGINFIIEEYDGKEWISEAHRTW